MSSKKYGSYARKRKDDGDVDTTTGEKAGPKKPRKKDNDDDDQLI